jgi:nitroreductase
MKDLLHPLLAQRFSARAYAPVPLTEAETAALLEAARWSPSSYNEQPWAFVLARRQDPAEFHRLLQCLGGNQAWAGDAGLLMACCAKRGFDRNGKANAHAWHDLGLAVMAMAVQGVSLGLQMREMAGIDRDAARAALGVPESYDIVTGLAVGRPTPEAVAAAAGRERQALKAFAYAGAWGRAWETPKPA